MRILIVLISFGLMVASSTEATGAAVQGSERHLMTDMKFKDVNVRGEYQSPEEALAKVENEKGLTDLIGVRKHFKDRLSVAAEQE